MNTWYTSDLHLGHNRIIELCNRPFTNVDQMDQTIVNNWNSVVSEEDNVFVLGDVAMGKLTDSLELVKQLNGTKYLIPGNHDRCWSGTKKIREVDIQRYFDAGFFILPEDLILKDRWRLCHFPYVGDSHEEDRYLAYRPIPKPGEWLLHGHVHNKWKVNDNQINVGVDVWDFYPVNETILEDIAGVGQWSSRSL